jgi:hypothetical protein
MSVAPPACESKVINSRRPAMFFRDNVIYFVREEGNLGGELAVFADVLCALDDLPA